MNETQTLVLPEIRSEMSRLASKVTLAEEQVNEVIGVNELSSIVLSYLEPSHSDVIKKARENLAKARENLAIDQKESKESKESKELTRSNDYRIIATANPGRSRYSCFQASKVAAVFTTVAAGLCLISSQF